MPDSPFKALIDTSSLWLPALTWLVARISATRPARKLEEDLKARLKFLRDPEVEKAFQSAFGKAIRRYERRRGQLPAALAVAEVLRDVAERDPKYLDRAALLDQLFEARPDIAELTEIVRGRFSVITALQASEAEVAAELGHLISRYLRPAFRSEPLFADRVSSAEMIGLLEDIRSELRAPQPDLDALRREYCAKIAEKYEFITMQGISPKVQNKTIGIRMRDIFIPLRMTGEPGGAGWWPWLGEDWAEVLSFPPEALALLDEFRRSLISGPAALAHTAGNRSESSQVTVQVKADISEDSVDRSRRLEPISARFRHVHDVEFSFSVADLLRLRRAVVCGDPGGGKSTLTAYLAWAIASGDAQLPNAYPTGNIPVRIRAIELGDAVEAGRCDALEAYLIDDAGRFGPLMKFALAAGKVVLMIDGLDEVSKPALRGQVKECVDDFISDPAFSANQIILTSRIIGYERSGVTGAFPHFTLSELDDEQIGAFVENWYRAIAAEMPDAIDVDEEKKQLLEAILGKESIHRLARNPLLLTIIALIKWQGRELPNQRVLLYDAATQTMIRTRPLTLRRIELDELLIREWLAPIAMYVLEHSANGLIDEYTLMEQCVASLRRLKSLTPFEAKQVSAELLESTSLHAGILLPRGTDADGRTLYGFLHQTFAEYLAAYQMAGQWEDGDLNLLRFAHDPYWREVLLLTAGQLGTDRRHKGGRFLKAVHELESSPYEQYIHRDLLLAGRILGDGVPVGPPELVEKVLRDLLRVWKSSPIEGLRRDARKVLGGLRATEHAQVLARLSRNEHLTPQQSVELAEALGAPHFLTSLSELLDSADDWIRLRCAKMLAGLNDAKALRVLDDLLGSEHGSIREDVAYFMLGRDPEVKVLETYFSVVWDSGSRRERYISGMLTPFSSPEFLKSLTTMLGSTDPRLQHAAASELARRGDDRGLPILRQLLTSADDLVRLAAARSLLERGVPEASAAMEQLCDASDPVIALEAAIALGANEKARSTLLRFLHDEYARPVQERASVALLKINEPAAREVVLSWLRSSDAAIRLSVAHAVTEVMQPEALETLGELLVHDNPAVRVEAAYYLFLAGEQLSADVLIELVPLQPAGINILGDMLLRSCPDSARTVFCPLLSSPDVSTRFAAASALANNSSPEAAQVIAERLPTLLSDTATSDWDWIGDRFAVAGGTVADTAYSFLRRHLTPSGEIRLQVEDAAEEQALA